MIQEYTTIETRSNRLARKNRHKKLSNIHLEKAFSDKSSQRSYLLFIRKGIHAFSELFIHGKVRYHISLLSLVLFVSTACLLPSFVSQNSVHASYSDGDGMVIPLEDDSIDELLRNANGVSAEGMISNQIINNSSYSHITDNNMIEYEVSEGDTISTIAEEFGISMQTLLGANDLQSSDRIKIGQTLIILPVDGILHEMSEDKNIVDVAKDYGVDTQLIADQNSLAGDTIIKKGAKIIIPGVTKDLDEQVKVIADANIAKPAVDVVSKKEDQAKKVEKKAAKVVPAKSTAKKDIPTIITKQGSKMVWPSASPVITTKYGGGHPGLDIAYTKGDHTTGIVAAMSGKVIQAKGGWNGGYGNMIVLDHGNGVQTRYAHMRELYVSVGQEVKAGQTIGWMGNTGNVRGRTGLHLHFEVIVNKTRANPYTYL